MTAILGGDIDRGYALMHSAVREDMMSNPDGFTESPAYALVTLDFQKVNQAFRPWVLIKADYLKSFLDSYQQTYERNFALEDFRGRFLLQSSNHEAVFLLAYVVGRLVNLQRLPPYALKSQFIAQLYLNLLFDVTLVIDAAIKLRGPFNKTTFLFLATHLANTSHLGMTQADLQNINDDFKTDFDTTLGSVLSGSYILKGKTTALSGLDQDLAIAYGIRNLGAHNLATVRIVEEKFQEILQANLNILFLTVETLYSSS